MRDSIAQKEVKEMFFPFRVKDHVATKKGSGYMFWFETQYGQTVGTFVPMDKCEKLFALYSVGSIHRLNLVPHNGVNGLELNLVLPDLVSDEQLF